MNDLSVYVHIPFCNGKCAYCDFVSGVYSDEIKVKYFASLAREIDAFDFSDYRIKTIYFGGGTPSVVSAEYIADIIERLNEKAVIADGAEITVECNPESLNTEKLEIYSKAGVNRLSIGLQAASDTLLRRIGRLHTVDDFIRALDDAQKFFSNISADLMLGLPGQSPRDVEKAVNLIAGRSLAHVSAYALKVEEGTPLALSGFTTDDDYAAELYDLTCNMLGEYGYGRYEVSNFAVPDFECKHNLVYWRRGEYKGFGMAAHSFVKNTRYENTRDWNYLDGVTVTEPHNIPPRGAEAAEETLMLALRTSDGLDLFDYKKLFGIDIAESKREEIELLRDYVEVKNGHLSLTDKGFYVMNEIIIRLLN